MAEARCPEPKPVFIVLITVSGVFGGIVVSCLGLIPTYHFWDSAIFIAWAGGAVGVSAGVAVAVSSRWWIAILVSPILGFVATAIATYAREIFIIGEVATLNTSGSIYWGMAFGAPACLAVSLSHIGWIMRVRRPVGIMGYLLLGALSMIPLLLYAHELTYPTSTLAYYLGRPAQPKPLGVWVHYSQPNWATVLPSGLVFGFIQLLAMLAALAVDRKMRPRLEPPSGAPAPEPAP